MPVLPGAGKVLPYCVRANYEPYFQGEWRKEPFPARCVCLSVRYVA